MEDPAPTPWHQVLVSRLADGLKPLVGAGSVPLSPIDLFIDEATRQVHSRLVPGR